MKKCREVGKFLSISWRLFVTAQGHRPWDRLARLRLCQRLKFSENVSMFVRFWDRGCCAELETICFPGASQSARKGTKNVGFTGGRRGRKARGSALYTIITPKQDACRAKSAERLYARGDTPYTLRDACKRPVVFPFNPRARAARLNWIEKIFNAPFA